MTHCRAQLPARHGKSQLFFTEANKKQQLHATSRAFRGLHDGGVPLRGTGGLIGAYEE